MASPLQEFSFASPHYLWLLLLVPLLGIFRGAPGRKAAVKFSSLSLLRPIGKPVRSAMGLLTALLAMIPLAAGVVALARPQLVHTEEQIQDSGIEIMIAMDISLSMAIEDYRINNERVNRVTIAKNVIRDFVAGRKSDRIGLVAFAGRPYLASPLTMDQRWFNKSLDRVGFNLVEDGTAIGSAIALSARRLDKREAKSKIILLLTDGANNSGEIAPISAAKSAKTVGIKIYTVAIGTPGRHQIPVANRQGMMPGIRQEFDDETLKAVAEIADGKFFKGQDTEAVRKIFQEIDQLEKSKLNVRKYVETTELFHYPVGAALMGVVVLTVFTLTAGRRHPS